MDQSNIMNGCHEAMQNLIDIDKEMVFNGTSRKVKEKIERAYQILKQLCEDESETTITTTCGKSLYYRPIKRNVFVAAVDEDHTEDVLVGNRVVCFWNPKNKIWCEDRLTEFEPPKKS